MDLNEILISNSWEKWRGDWLESRILNYETWRVLNEASTSNSQKEKMEDLLENIGHEVDELQTIDIWYSGYYQIMKLIYFQIRIYDLTSIDIFDDEGRKIW